eukprot:771821-Pyramimonas_sp.AAC.2
MVPSRPSSRSKIQGLLMSMRRHKWDIVFLSDATFPGHITYFGLEEFVLLGAGRCGFLLAPQLARLVTAPTQAHRVDE